MSAGVGTDNEATRDAWVRAKLSDIPVGWRLLDAGAGERPYRQSCAHLIYVSQDFGAYTGTGPVGLQDGSWDATGVDITSDVTAIPEPEGSFDAILCTEVLEHIPDPIAAIREFARLVRPGGCLILTAPFASLTHQAPYHFSTGFSRFWYEHHLPALGFEITGMAANGNYFEYLAQELRRDRDVASQFAKPLRPHERFARRLMLRSLKRSASLDRGSSELLCYGWHVVAIRL